MSLQRAPDQSKQKTFKIKPFLAHTNNFLETYLYKI